MLHFHFKFFLMLRHLRPGVGPDPPSTLSDFMLIFFIAILKAEGGFPGYIENQCINNPPPLLPLGRKKEVKNK